MLVKVYQVNTVTLGLYKTNPLTLAILVTGTVSSSGWSGATLIPYVYVMPPADGIYEFDLVAWPPEGTALTVLMPIGTSAEWHDFPPDLKGVRIYSSTNNVEQKLTGEEASLTFGGGSGNPRGLIIENQY